MKNESGQEAGMKGWLLRRVQLESGPHGICWIWKLKPNIQGYGQFTRMSDRKKCKAHTAMYEEYRSEVPKGQVLHHLCHTPLCTNPWHLKAMTQSDHMRLSGDDCPTIINARKTDCARGHAFSEENTYITPQGRRNCRECLRLKAAAFREKQRAGWVKPFRIKITVRLNKRLRFTHCSKGHEWSAENTWADSKFGNRICKKCAQTTWLKTKATQREKKR